MIKRKCLQCGNEFTPHRSNLRNGGGFYCSRACAGKAKIGYKQSEETKKKISKTRKGKYTGAENPNWKGGKIKIYQGYILIFIPKHPFANSRGYYPEHRLVMEKHINRLILPKEIVHHINGNKTDNRIENLQLLPSQSEHTRLHFTKNRKCSICDRKHHGSGLCELHYMRLKRATTSKPFLI